MSYFFNNKLYNYYQLNDTSIGSKEITKDVIEIINNEKVIFDFTNLMVQSPTLDVLNSSVVETTKIRIDWGDGQIDRLSMPLVSNKSTIGTYRPDSWKMIEHLFNVQKRYEYETDDVSMLHQITVTTYNSFNDKLIVHIPYKMVYKTLYDLGSELSLFSSNTTNKNSVSYTLKQLSSDSIFVVNSYNSIYGNDDEIVTIKKTVSEVFSDEFANEDLMTWDWNSVPSVTLFPKTDNTNGIISCSFIESGIKVEQWQPRIEFIQDDGNVLIDVAKDEVNNAFVTTSKTTLESGVYVLYINPIIGINGVSGASDKSYVLYDTNIYPRELRQVDNSDVIKIQDNRLVFDYAIPTPHQVKSLTKAELVLTANYQDDTLAKNYDVSDVRFSYDLLAPIKDSVGDDKEFSYSIPMRNIPNEIYLNETHGVQKIKYNVKVITNDVLGNSDNEKFFDINGDEIDLSDCFVEFNDYTIGSFTTEEPTVIPYEDNSKNITLGWMFDKADDWGEFRVKVTDGGDNVFYSDTHRWIKDDEFDGLKSIYDSEGKLIKINKIINGNRLPDGDCTITVDYVVEMADYYDIRKKTCQVEYNYTYPRPIINVSDIQPYTTINYDKIKNSYSLELKCDVTSDFKEEELSNITITTPKGVQALSELKYTYGIDDSSPKKYSFSFNGNNAHDLYERQNKTPITSTLEITDDIDNLLSLPTNGDDYLGGNYDTHYVKTDDNTVVDWMWVKENSIHDVNKAVSFQNGKYFGGEDNNKFEFNGKERRAVYEILEIENGGTKHRRFVPFRGKYSELGTPTSLKSCDEVLKEDYITSSTKYDTFYDKGDLLVTWKSDYNLTPQMGKVQNMWLKLYKVEQEQDILKQEIDIKDLNVEGIFNYKFAKLDFGSYKYEFILNSEYTKTAQNTSKRYPIKVLVPPNEAIVHIGKPNTTDATTTTKYVNFRWQLNHLACTDVRFRYQVEGEDQIYDVTYVRLQNFTQTQPISIGKTVNYWFEMKSPYLDTENGSADEWQVINKSSYTLQ